MKKAVKTDGKDLELINLKVTKFERAALKRMAKKYASGNLSAWLRHAGLKYRPSDSVIIS